MKGTNWHGEYSEVYWKLYRRQNGLVTILCMQWFDEYDYYEDRFIVDSNDNVHAFNSEELAIKKLNEWFSIDEIDPKYQHIKHNNIRD